MALIIIFNIFSGMLVLYLSIILIVFIASFFRKKLKTDQFLQPLDRVDAEKLTAMVDEQIKLHITPLMQSKGYTEEKIKEILTAKPVASKQSFRR